MSRFSPIQQLPCEVKHMVFSYLEPEDVTGMRLMCKSFAEIGLHYLLRSYHLIMKKSSFERLLEISRHPVVSQYVKSNFYEPDTLRSYDSMKEWEKHILDIDFPYNVDHYPDEHEMNQREKRLWRRNYLRFRQGPRWTSSKKQLRYAYAIYRQYFEEQQKIRENAYNAQIINDAMKWLPNLSVVRMNMCFGLEDGSHYEKEAFNHSLQHLCGDEYQLDNSGVTQSNSLLLGALNNNIKIQELGFGFVDWRLFEAEEHTFTKLCKAVQHLKTLEMHSSTTSSSDGKGDPNGYHPSVLACAAFLSGGRLREFASAAPDLVDLSIEFDTDNPQPPARLIDIVGSFTWHALHHVHFSLVSFTGEDLICFCRRHSASLRKIRFDEIMLLQGTWQDVFPRIKETVRLEEARITGHLGDGGEPRYYLGLPPRVAYLEGEPPLIKVVVERSLLDRKEDSVLPSLFELKWFEGDYYYLITSNDDSDLASNDGSPDSQQDLS